MEAAAAPFQRAQNRREKVKGQADIRPDLSFKSYPETDNSDRDYLE